MRKRKNLPAWDLCFAELAVCGIDLAIYVPKVIRKREFRTNARDNYNYYRSFSFYAGAQPTSM